MTRVVAREGGQSWVLADREENRLGEGWTVSWCYRVNRRAHADIRLLHESISKHHGRIVFVDGRWWVEDGCSVNGITVNGAPIGMGATHPLDDGDVLGFGRLQLAFETDGGPPQPIDS